MTFDSAIHRAAILIKSLPQQQARKLMAHLDTVELQTVVRQMRTAEEVTASQRALAMNKFIDAAEHEQTMGRASNLKNEKLDDSEGPFDFLDQVSASIRFKILSNEHPGVAAIVLSFLPTTKASQTLNQFEPERRVAILRRLCQSKTFDPKQIAKVAHQLNSQLNNLLLTDRYHDGGVGVATKLLSCVDSETQDFLINSIRDFDPEMARELSTRTIRFTDLTRLSDEDTKLLLQWVDTSLWSPALRNSSKRLRNKILGNMAERPRQILQSEILSVSRFDQRKVAEAQSQVISKILELAEKNLISLPPNPSAAA